MHYNFYQFDFELPNQDESDKLIAMLSQQGFDGFEEDDNSLIAFIPELEFNQSAFEKVLEKFSVVAYTQSVIENINWNRQWEENFEPVLVGSFVGVRAHFHPALKNVQHEIIITPKMSFGTGHHATTYLMLQQMQLLDFVNKKVFDFGTGTGILAILAEKMWAASVLAADNDEWSITNATENILKNDCRRITVAGMDRIPANEKYDIILANINLNVIAANFSLLAAAALPGTIILLGGFLKGDQYAVQAGIDKAGFQPVSTVQKGEWIVVKAKKI